MKSARGAAIILAMLVAALAATVAVALAGDQQRWLADVASRRDQVQAQSLALAGVQWARQILQDDARSSSVDHLGEIWAYPLPATPIASGSIEGRIEDAQGRLNLNNVDQAAPVGEVERARLASLFASKGVDPKTIAALGDWIDDDATVRSAMVHLLQSWGCPCDNAESLEEALPLALQNPPACIISDYRLRGPRTGAHAITELRQQLHRHGGRHTPALIITGDTAPERLREALASGIPQLHKPISPEQLYRALVELQTDEQSR